MAVCSELAIDLQAIASAIDVAAVRRIGLYTERPDRRVLNSRKAMPRLRTTARMAHLELLPLPGIN
jgi:hypothetical protein